MLANEHFNRKKMMALLARGHSPGSVVWREQGRLVRRWDLIRRQAKVSCCFCV